ncbi:TIGR03617 family F420-dependent LLM class oxidoreductase [Vineibacter terrae]|uniref:TIGR03617 family F420-dependent LLM class oxidoreductase n=1 Tax=Vineibacter terrae TaxID=2586908 RepID=UPI002E2F2222|nr:TIGR03617 family F420-dependent LLM class oxidoreductase [Vineibacter terrae]HEX2889950.1 TIGR03617 family F420-dependent LLM class oxidoreductase [Vineibacter terrae]
MRVVTTVPQDDLRNTAAVARQAEAAGFDGLITLENRHDPFLAHAVAALATERIELGTAVAIAFPRSPMVVANACWDLQVASRGRFVLGLGPQIRPHNEKRFSVPWSAPAPRMRDYVNALRAIWTAWEKGTKLDYRGTHYTFTLMTPNFVPPSRGFRMVPITLAAVGEHTLRLAGELADGVRLHSFCTRRYLEEAVLPRLHEGLARNNRSRSQLEITGGGFIATGPDVASVARAVEFVRMRVAFYGSTPAYWPVLELHGLGDLARKLNAMSKQGQWTEMTAVIPDDVVHLFAAVGTHQEIAGVVAQRFGGLVDTIYASANSAMQSDLPPDVLQDIHKLPTAFTGYVTPW